MPPHSIEVLVDADVSHDQAVADELWLCKPAGIYTFGTTSKTVIDSMGHSHTIRLAHPKTRGAWFYITITTNALYPATGDDLVKAAIKAYGDTLEIGDDFIYQEFYTQIFTVPGVLTASINVMLPKVAYTIPNGAVADLTALVANLQIENPLFNVPTPVTDEYNGYLEALGTYDCVDGSLATAKGSSRADKDIFRFTNIGVGTEVVVYVGNLAVTSTGYIQPTAGYFTVTGSERAVFDISRITIV
jgi:hypothetical protein